MKTVSVSTDGACRGNPGVGGWGAVLGHGERTLEIKGAEADTTNNRMELTAAIRALEALKAPCAVNLTTDSLYVRNGVTDWLSRWKANGWRTRSRQPVKNQDLWLQMDKQLAIHRIHWHWVKGHSGHPGNERADMLANAAIDELLSATASRKG